MVGTAGCLTLPGYCEKLLSLSNSHEKYEMFIWSLYTDKNIRIYKVLWYLSMVFSIQTKITNSEYFCHDV